MATQHVNNMGLAGLLWAKIPGSVRDFIEVGGLLGCGVIIGLLCSRVGGTVMDAVGVCGTLVLFFAAGWLFLTRKVLKDHDAKAFLVQSLFSVKPPLLIPHHRFSPALPLFHPPPYPHCFLSYHFFPLRPSSFVPLSSHLTSQPLCSPDPLSHHAPTSCRLCS